MIVVFCVVVMGVFVCIGMIVIDVSYVYLLFDCGGCWLFGVLYGGYLLSFYDVVCVCDGDGMLL